jgi:flagellar biosynthesis component FlhA
MGKLMITREELEERLREHEDKIHGLIHKKVIEGIMTIEDAKQTMAQLAEVKKMNIKKVVEDAVDNKINGKIDRLNKNVETAIKDQRKWNDDHTLYHKKYEASWGIIRQIRNAYDKNPFRAIGILVTSIITAPVLTVRGSREFIINTIKNLWKSFFG